MITTIIGLSILAALVAGAAALWRDTQRCHWRTVDAGRCRRRATAHGVCGLHAYMGRVFAEYHIDPKIVGGWRR